MYRMVFQPFPPIFGTNPHNSATTEPTISINVSARGSGKNITVALCIVGGIVFIIFITCVLCRAKNKISCSTVCCQTTGCNCCGGGNATRENTSEINVPLRGKDDADQDNARNWIEMQRKQRLLERKIPILLETSGNPPDYTECVQPSVTIPISLS